MLGREVDLHWTLIPEESCASAPKLAQYLSLESQALFLEALFRVESPSPLSELLAVNTWGLVWEIGIDASVPELAQHARIDLRVLLMPLSGDLKKVGYRPDFLRMGRGSLDVGQIREPLASHYRSLFGGPTG
jgi:hypothetical protein